MDKTRKTLTKHNVWGSITNRVIYQGFKPSAVPRKRKRADISIRPFRSMFFDLVSSRKRLGFLTACFRLKVFVAQS